MRRLKLILLLVCGFVVLTVSLLLTNPGEDVYKDYMSLNNNGSYNSKSRFVKEYEYHREKEIKEENEKTNQMLSDEYIVPDNLEDVESFKSYVSNLNISEKRKELLLDGLNMFKKATYSNKPAAHNNWNKETFSQIECSGFVAWCYNKVGIQFGAPATGAYKEDNYMTIVDNNNAIPGDIGHVYAKERKGKSSGHVGLYLGVNNNGDRVYLDAGSNDCPKIVIHKELDTRTWRILEIQQYDK